MSEINEKSHLQQYIEKMDSIWTEFYKERDKCNNCIYGDMLNATKICDFHLEKGRNIIKTTVTGTIDV